MPLAAALLALVGAVFAAWDVAGRPGCSGEMCTPRAAVAAPEPTELAQAAEGDAAPPVLAAADPPRRPGGRIGEGRSVAGAEPKHRPVRLAGRPHRVLAATALPTPMRVGRAQIISPVRGAAADPGAKSTRHEMLVHVRAMLRPQAPISSTRRLRALALPRRAVAKLAPLLRVSPSPRRRSVVGE